MANTAEISGDVASNVQIALEFETLLNTRRLGEAAGLLTPNLRLHFPPSCVPMVKKMGASIAEGQDPFIDGLESWRQVLTATFDDLYSDLNHEIVHSFGSGDMVAILLRVSATLPPDDRPYENSYLIHFRLENGKIAEMWEYFDTTHSFGQWPAPAEQ
jgi:ketosteroid isomerase-like protein